MCHIPTLAGTEALLASLWRPCARRCSPQALHRLPPLFPGQGRHLQTQQATSNAKGQVSHQLTAQQQKCPAITMGAVRQCYCLGKLCTQQQLEAAMSG